MSDVLIVDDRSADRASLAQTLARVGYHVHESGGGTDALQQATRLRPHTILVSAALPGPDGPTLCSLLRAEALCREIPILVRVAESDHETVRRALEAGADDVISPDAAEELLLARVRSLVRSRQMALVARLNEQLAQIGRLLAGIVHEIRGPLGVIRGNAELIRLHLTDDPQTDRFVEPILRTIQTLQARVDHLMAAVRGGPSASQPQDIAQLVREAGEIFAKGTGAHDGRVGITYDIQPDLPPVPADAGRIIQVLLNLLANAREAITARASDQRGSIRLSARLQALGPEGDDAVVVEVADDGPGIDSEILHMVFEPFFTTKENGSGYGLYLAREILREHGGRIEAANQPDGGARFAFQLPLLTPDRAQGEIQTA